MTSENDKDLCTLIIVRVKAILPKIRALKTSVFESNILKAIKSGFLKATLGISLGLTLVPSIQAQNQYLLLVGGALEICADTNQKECSKEDLSPATKDILGVVHAVAGQSESKLVLSITASSRDPYESADFYEGLFATEDIKSEWLPLTPALANAMMADDCKNLDSYRQELTQPISPESNLKPKNAKGQLPSNKQVTSELAQAEQELCDKGIQHLKKKLQSAAVVMLNGGGQSLTRQSFFADNGTAYPWLEDVLNAPMLAGTSAGTAVQSGGQNQYGKVPMITNGSSIQALLSGAVPTPLPAASTTSQNTPSVRCAESEPCNSKLHSEQMTYLPNGGVGSFELGVLDTHFSERNRSVRLFKLLNQTGQKVGFGVDETTALLVAFDEKGAQLAVIGHSGVAVIEPQTDASFLYSYWPAGSKARFENNEFILTGSGQVEEKIRLSLPQQLPSRFEDILQNGKLRSLTQVMCMTDMAKAQGVQQYISDDGFDTGLHTWVLNFEKTTKTQFELYSTQTNRCAIEGLKISVSKLKSLF